MPCENCQAEETEEETEVGELGWETLDEEIYPSSDKCDDPETEEKNDMIVLPPQQEFLSLTVMKKKVKCDTCNKWLLPSSLPAHKLKHAGKRFFCDICNGGFNYKYALKHHLKQHYKMEMQFFGTRSCHICLQEFSAVTLLRDHLQTVHDITWKLGAGVFSCQQCFKPFDDLFKLRIHMKLYHDTELPVRMKAPGMKQFECHVCKQVLKSENAARNHMRKVHNLTNNQMESLKQACEECGKMFSVRQNLINHVNAAHLKVKPMECSECGERFGKHSSLIFHKLRHTGEKPFQCSFCMKTYRQRNDVMRHLARHVRDKEVEYDEAYAINTSSSKYISKRYVFLKDSTIKGLRDVAMCTPTPRKRKQSKKPAATYLYFPEDTVVDTTEGETYEEIVVPEGAVLVDEDGNYVLPEDSEGVSYIVEEGAMSGETEGQSVASPGGTQYELHVNEAGDQFLVQVEAKTEEAAE